MVANISTLAKVRYKAALSTISLSDLMAIDKIFSSTFRDATKNMFSFPTTLIYLARKYGGLGITRFSDEVQIDKLSKIQAALRSDSLHHQATQGLLNRAVRKSGVRSIHGQRLVIGPTAAHNARNKQLYTDSTVQWLSRHDLRLCRHGSIPSLGSLSTPIYMLPGVSTEIAKPTTCTSLRTL